jgi:hypothetical protein
MISGEIDGIVHTWLWETIDLISPCCHFIPATWILDAKRLIRFMI